MFLNGLYEFLGVNVLGFHRTISEMCVRLTWEGEGGVGQGHQVDMEERRH